MTSILIVEDEVIIAEYLKDTLNSMGFDQICLAHNRQQALEEIESFKPDLILLDIRMKHEHDGIFIAEKVAAETNIPFIFITAHSDKEILEKAIKTRPAAYLTKPFKKMDVFAAISLVTDEKNVEKRNLIVKDGYTSIALPIKDILYIESDGNYISIVTCDRKYTIRNSLDWCLQQLPESGFKRIHRSYIVNLKEIEKVTTKHVVIGGKSIPKSRSVDFDWGS